MDVLYSCHLNLQLVGCCVIFFWDIKKGLIMEIFEIKQLLSDLEARIQQVRDWL